MPVLPLFLISILGLDCGLHGASYFLPPLPIEPSRSSLKAGPEWCRAKWRRSVVREWRPALRAFQTRSCSMSVLPLTPMPSGARWVLARVGQRATKTLGLSAIRGAAAGSIRHPTDIQTYVHTHKDTYMLRYIDKYMHMPMHVPVPMPMPRPIPMPLPLPGS